ncbi:MAG: hypothetical protein FWD14_05165 [Treponema sp.]|nr:hypothetical protein [Treponema sp.]
MAESDEWREIKYKEVFDQEIRGLNRRRQSDTGCKTEDLEGILSNLYILEGADHDGRGTLQDTILSATIAAYEHFIHQWRLESQK